jgi:phage major head subunit gpT-like protein
MIETRAKWTDLIPDTGLKIAEVVDQGDMLYTPGIPSLLNTKNAPAVAQQNYTGKTGFGKLKKFADGDDIPEVSRDKTYTTSVLYNNYGGTVMVTKNQIEDRDFAAELDEMKDLSRSYNQSIDESSMQLFNGGFATTVSVNGYDMTWYGDGKPLFSTVHPTPVAGGSTQSNASSTGIKLTHDNLETGRLALTLQQTDNGRPMTLTTSPTIVAPVTLEKKATESIASVLTPESSNNALNFFKGSINLVTTAFLDTVNGGSNTAWFLINRERHSLYYETRQEKRLESEKNILNKVVTYTLDARWANYAREWKGVWGSKGDLATYSS